MSVPAGIVHDDTHHYTKRAGGEVEVHITSDFTLRKGARRVDVHTVIDNAAANHRIRAHFPTGLAEAKNSYAETPYDVVERVIDRAPEHPYSQAINPMYPCLRFAGVADKSAGLAVITGGIHEYEVSDDPSRTLILTLLRAYEVTLCTVSWRWERRPDQEMSQLPLVPVQAGRSEGRLPREGSLFEIKPASLVLSALKRAEDRPKALILRLNNPLARLERAKIRFPLPVAKARIVTMNEETLRGAPAVVVKVDTIEFEAPAKKIITVEVTLAKARPGKR
jgi:alpha-mannosidase